MPDIIQLLPDSVANQIAAGEVIQRPASVVKELVENAVDAGASHIQVVITDAGRTAIQVTDDGKGMSETDARLAFERHATSKIRAAADLFTLTTMGFRGEALPSIAAVAQVELVTRRPEDEVGVRLRINGSRFAGQEPCSAPQGSSFTVSNLFYNVPARRKFLKSNATELNNILTAFERIALVYPDTAFTLRSGGTDVFCLKAAGQKQRIADIFGKRMDSDLIPVSVDTPICRIGGYVGKPEAARKKGALQFFFVNGRYMKHPYFHKAVMNAVERLVPAGEQVPYFLYFTVPAENIDVNIHPTKTEIKFTDEQSVWQILFSAVKDAIGVFNDVPSIDFDTEGRPDIPVFSATGSGLHAPKVEYNPAYNPFKASPATADSKAPNRWETLYEGLAAQPQQQPQQTEMFASAIDAQPQAEVEHSPQHYQHKGMYVMASVKSGLMVIDQHRAHVRVLYDKYMRQLTEKGMDAQRALFPEMIQLSPADAATYHDVEQEMTRMGFELTPLGADNYSVTAIPAGLEGIDVHILVTDLIAAAREKETDSSHEAGGEAAPHTALHKMALSLARHAAIPRGQVLCEHEMETLVADLFATENVNYTPDGKTILTIIRQEEMERLLG